MVMGRRGAAPSTGGPCWYLVWLLAAIGASADNTTTEAVGETNRLVALGQEVTLECKFQPGREVEYSWMYRHLCEPTEWSKFVSHGHALSTFSGNFSFTPTAPAGKLLPAFKSPFTTNLTIYDSSSILAAVGGTCPTVAIACRIADVNERQEIAEFHLNLYDPARIRGSTFEQLSYNESSASSHCLETPTIVTLPCNATGIPAPTIRWTKTSGGDLQPQTLPTGGFEHAGPLLSFAATAASAGNYTCFAYNAYGNASRTVEVSIRSKPTVRTQRPRQAQAAGYYVSLVCFAESAEPVSAIRWEHDGRVVASSGAVLDHGAVDSWSDPAVNASDHNRIIMKKPVIRDSLYTSELLVGVSRSDYKKIYSCYFYNAHGESSADVQIVAADRAMPTFSEGRKPYSGETSSSAILRASILLLLLGFLLHDLF